MLDQISTETVNAPKWLPLPGSQVIALTIPCDEILYTGTRGPGKTDTQLMRFRARVGMGYGMSWRGIIIDREYKHLDDLVLKSKRWFRDDGGGGRFLESKSDYKWVWPDGEELLFRVADKEEDYWLYHGQEFPFIGWNELCKYPNGELYDLMLSCNRSSFIPANNTPRGERWARNSKGEPSILIYRNGVEGQPNKFMPSIPLEVFSTTNSYGPGHAWVKRRFINVAPYGKVIRTVREIFNPQTQRKEKVTRSQVAIFGQYKENVFLDPKYIAVLDGEKNKMRRRAWLTGDWDIVAGGAFDDLWDTGVHIVPRFVVPDNWHIDRAMDWGSSTPFHIAWFAEATGEDVQLLDGSIWTPKKGSIIQIFEWYGAKQVGTNEGLRLSPSKIAQDVLTIEKSLLRNGWIKTVPAPGPADNQIRAVVRTDIDTIAKTMENEGVHWQASDKSKGSRTVGFEVFRDRLAKTIGNAGAGFYVMDNNLVTIELLPSLPRDTKILDDVDTDAEDHIWDVIRYRTLKGNIRWASEINIGFVH